MSGIKRKFLAEECLATTNDKNSSLIDNNIQPTSPIDSPQSKKLRRSSSHHTTDSENDDETQEDRYEQESGTTNGNKSFNYFLNKNDRFCFRFRLMKFIHQFNRKDLKRKKTMMMKMKKQLKLNQKVFLMIQLFMSVLIMAKMIVNKSYA